MAPIITPQELVEEIQAGHLLPAVMFAAMDCDAILDARDRNSNFEQAWLTADKELEKKWKTLEPANELVQAEENVRREAFLAVFDATRHHDMAACVSDDFGLIALSSILGELPPLVASLWESYLWDKIPPAQSSDSTAC